MFFLQGEYGMPGISGPKGDQGRDCEVPEDPTCETVAGPGEPGSDGLPGMTGWPGLNGRPVSMVPGTENYFERFLAWRRMNSGRSSQ